MKRFRFILTVVLMVSAGALTSEASAQEKSKAEKEKELQLQEEQKNAAREQRKALDEMSRTFDEQKIANDAMKEAQKQIEAASRYKDMVRVYRDRGDFPRIEFNGEPFVYAPGGDAFFHSMGDERTSWDFSKSMKENSFSGDYAFEVEPASKNVVMSINGDCKAGEIRIKIIQPGGKTYSDIVIDEFGNLNWRKSFTISEEENKDKIGDWKFKVDASKATGFFKISLQSY